MSQPFRLHLMTKPLAKLLRLLFRYIEILLVIALIMFAAVQYLARPQSQSYDEIIESGVLRVLITDEPDSQYVFNRQRFGFEYDLLTRFADSLGVELELEVVPYGEIFSLLEMISYPLNLGE